MHGIGQQLVVIMVTGIVARDKEQIVGAYSVQFTDWSWVRNIRTVVDRYIDPIRLAELVMLAWIYRHGYTWCIEICQH